MAYKYPGVYVEEVPGAKTITGVSTDIAAFIGIAEFGETNKPTLITSWSEYQTKFGGFIWNRYLAFSVYNFFALGGSQCYVVNVELPSNFEYGKKTIDCSNTSLTEDTDPDQNNSITFRTSSKGDWATSIHFGISTSPLNAGSSPVSFDVQVLADPGTLGSCVSLSSIMVQEYITANESEPVGASVYTASTPGFDSDFFDERRTRVLEEFTGFTYTDLVKNQTDQLSPFEKRINSTSLFLRVEQGTIADNYMPASIIGALDNSAGVGKDILFTDALNSLDKILDFATVVVTDEVDQVQYGDGGSTDGTHSGIQIQNATIMKNTINTLFDTKAATDWRRAFAVTSSPYGYDYAGVKGFKEGTGPNVGTPINSEWGAIYYPWFQFVNPYTNKKLWLPPGGSMLGIYANSDNLVGVWKAPAGVEFGKLSVASALEVMLTNDQQGVLNPIGVDAIRSILTYGICVYGARTVSLNPEWKYVNVRRLAIYIEQSLYFGLQWVVFEPNSPKLWQLVTRDVTTFMNTLWRDGGLFGTSASEAFFVVCDSSNNPPETIDQGILFIDIGFAPVKPAEFVVLRLSQITLTS